MVSTFDLLEIAKARLYSVDKMKVCYRDISSISKRAVV